MGCCVLDLQEIDQTQVAVAGGKGAALGELARIEGIRVPAGFCVTAEAYGRVVRHDSSVAALLNRLARASAEDRDRIRALSAELRRAVEGIAIPADLAGAVARSLARFGPEAPYAVRSSATAEDLPAASFAGQHDTHLNVTGQASILRHISRCWASLFTERAIAYRVQHGIHHRDVEMAVVVQEMVRPRAAGTLFTADPVTSNRRVACVEAGFGLGEAVVSGLANADLYEVRGGEVALKRRAARPVTAEDAPERATAPEPVLTDEEVVRLVALGRRIEAHFGRPQDIEWCLARDGFQIVQSRPMTTLFPIPAASDGENHVYLSVGHQQMMTDAMKPLGASIWQLTALVPMHEAGGRLFVDVAPRLKSAAARAGIIELVGRSDPLTGDALRTVLARDDFIPSLPGESDALPPPLAPLTAAIEANAATVAELIDQSEASIAALKRTIAAKSRAELLDFILADIGELQRLLRDPRSVQVIMAGMQAAWWLGDQLEAWLGERDAADVLSRSVADNVTSEMGLALLDVADVVRAHPAVVAFLQRAEHDRFLDELAEVEGGQEARAAIEGYIERYGMRCVGEIDITRPRFSERPTTLVPMILANVRNHAPGAAARQFAHGREAARAKELDVLERLRALPDGARKADEAKRMIDRLRTFIGYREYPKYGIVSRHFVYKQALLKESERLVRAGVLDDEEDVFYLTFQELHDVVRTLRVDDQLIGGRKRAFRSNQALTPPRVLTSDGEVIAGAYRRGDFPAGALVGLPVSTGIVEGRARIVRDLSQADLEPGDILVTTYTDPSWAPMFVSLTALVTEVGGLMTHGAVIAREYGLPAVVGVQNATRLIPDGQHIRVHGTSGYVEILPQPPAGRAFAA
jgi:pyruvate,water dikinase